MSSSSSCVGSSSNSILRTFHPLLLLLLWPLAFRVQPLLLLLLLLWTLATLRANQRWLQRLGDSSNGGHTLALTPQLLLQPPLLGFRLLLVQPLQCTVPPLDS
jgi:hypothetical protein